VADSAHCALLKFLFLQACEPYCGFIRSWIFKAEIHDPYKEFIVENMECFSPKSHDQAGNSVDFLSASIRLRDGVPIPGFLKDLLVPLVRAGQQLQVPMHAPVPSVDNGGGTLDKLGQLMSEDEPIVRPTADKSSSNM
ncbi:hypothetical protein TSUD_115500, partial [Trifolium subterraneum]